MPARPATPSLPAVRGALRRRLRRVRGQVLFPRYPVRAMAKAARPVVDDLSIALAVTTEALRDGDEQRAIPRFRPHAPPTTTSPGSTTRSPQRATFVLRRPGRRTRERLPLYTEAAQQMDYAVRNTRVLVSRALSAIRRGGPARALADAVALLGDAVLERADAVP